MHVLILLLSLQLHFRVPSSIRQHRHCDWFERVDVDSRFCSRSSYVFLWIVFSSCSRFVSRFLVASSLNLSKDSLFHFICTLLRVPFRLHPPFVALARIVFIFSHSHASSHSHLQEFSPGAHIKIKIKCNEAEAIFPSPFRMSPHGAMHFYFIARCYLPLGYLWRQVTGNARGSVIWRRYPKPCCFAACSGSDYHKETI